MKSNPVAFLRHILLCLDRIANCTTGGRGAFFIDAKTQDAVIRNLEIIGQAVRDLGIEQLSIKFPSVR